MIRCYCPIAVMREFKLRRAYALILLGAVCAFAAGCGSSGSSSDLARSSLTTPTTPSSFAGEEDHAASGSTVPFRFFASSSVWNTPVENEPVDPESTQYVKALTELVASENGAWINTTKYSVPVYTVGARQPVVTVQLVHHHPNAALSRAWRAVPLPNSAAPSVGTDGALVIWQPSTDRLWEFWRLRHEGEGGGWSAWWGGVIQHVSLGSGVNGPQSWPGAQSWWGVAATSLSLVGGLISLEDLQRGVINHALSMSLPNVRAGVYVAPAQRTDGRSSEPYALPEGAHLRLDPTLNLKELNLPRMTLMMAEAAQRYGIIVNDRAANVTFQAQDPVPTGTEPYRGPNGYFEGMTPRQLLAKFPWGHLELLKMELHKVRHPRRAALSG
jgi:hypothetical protein